MRMKRIQQNQGFLLSQADSVSELHLPGTLGSSELPRAGSMGFKGAPDLVLDRLIGCGSFGRVYKGAPCAP